MSSEKYHYEPGAIHNDYHKEINIGSVPERAFNEIVKNFFKDDADDAVYSNCEPSIGSANDYKVALSTSRQSILDQLLNLADKGDWVNGITSEDVKAMLKIVLGQGETPLSVKETEHSEILWRLLEIGRGDRVKIVWQKIVGYLDDKKLFRQKGSPALNKDFFGDDKGYTNIDKGRPNKGLMTPDFESIIPLLDAYVPKLDKKA